MTEQKPLWRRLLAGASRRFLPHSDWGDRMYAHQHSRNAHGRPPAPNTYPVRFNDYLFKMKTDGTLLEPMRQFISDKEYVKTYIGGTVGWEHTVKTLAVLRHPDEVDSLKLEHFPCVLKPTHTSGNVIFITDLEVPLERDLLRSWFTIDYYKQTREQNYRFLRPKIIVEEFFSEDGVTPPKDFKVFCFGGGGFPKLFKWTQTDIFAIQETSTISAGIACHLLLVSQTSQKMTPNPLSWTKCSTSLRAWPNLSPLFE